MRRILVFCLVISLCLGIFSGMTACSNMESFSISTGEWLAWINDSFGMYDYYESEPYVKNVTADNEYFSVVQIAYEWEIIDQNTTKLNINAPVRYKQALISLVNAGVFIPLTSSDDEKLEYALANFPVTVEGYQLERYISPQDGKSLIMNVQTLWANQEYEENFASVSYLPEVKDFTSDIYTDINYIIDETSNTIKIQTNELINILPGDIFVLPANQNNISAQVFKAKDVIIENGYITVEKDITPIEIDEFTEEIQIQETITPNLLNCVIYDGNGKLVSNPYNVTNTDTIYNSSEPYIGNLLYNDSSNNMEKQVLQNIRNNFEMEISGYKVKVSFTDNKVSAQLQIPISDKSSFYTSFELSDFCITTKVDYKFPKLKSALLKVDYETKTKGGFKSTYKSREIYAPMYSNGNGKVLTNLLRSERKLEIKDKSIGAKTIKILSLKVPGSSPLGSLNLEIYVKLKIDGSISVICTENGQKGIEYRDKKVRAINTSEKDWDLEFKAKLEICLGFGPVVYALGSPIIGCYVEVGIGFEASVVLHLATLKQNYLIEEISIDDIPPEAVEATSFIGLKIPGAEFTSIAKSNGAMDLNLNTDQELHIDTCVDLSAYFILRVGLTEDTFVVNKMGIKWSADILNSKNSKFLHTHIDNGDWDMWYQNTRVIIDVNEDLCTLKYTPWNSTDSPEQNEQTDTPSNTSVNELDFLLISNVQITQEVGEKRTIRVEHIPSGYQLTDIVFYSNDQAIAKIDKNGVVTGIKPGITSVVITTKDMKYKMQCMVIVLSSSDDNNENYLPNLGGGGGF